MCSPTFRIVLKPGNAASKSAMATPSAAFAREACVPSCAARLRRRSVTTRNSRSAHQRKMKVSSSGSSDCNRRLCSATVKHARFARLLARSRTAASISSANGPAAVGTRFCSLCRGEKWPQGRGLEGPVFRVHKFGKRHAADTEVGADIRDFNGVRFHQFSGDDDPFFDRRAGDYERIGDPAATQ
jgi:hypothetical protein